MNANRRLSRRCLVVHRVAMVVAMHCAGATAFAQQPGRVTGEEGGVLPWCIALGITAVICASGFLDPKRSHLT